MGCGSSVAADETGCGGRAAEDLREYFQKHYKEGGQFCHEAYLNDAEDWCWLHKDSNIRVWQDALDLTSDGAAFQCFFHYTSEVGFRNITNEQKEAVEVFASLVTEGENANAWWGKGVYSVRKAPHDWSSIDSVIDNNFRNMLKRDIKTKGLEAASEEYNLRVRYCIPILANTSSTYDVSVQQTPEMEQNGKPPGTNLAGKLLNEPGKATRECVVIRMSQEEKVANARSVLVATLRTRAEAMERDGANHLDTLAATARLASVLHDRGLFEEAEPLCWKVLEGREEELGMNHRDTINSVNNLGALLQDLGDLAGAEPFYRRALEGQETQLGMNHPDTINSVNNLGALLKAQGDLSEAELLYRRALKSRESRLGTYHPDTLTSMNNLGALLHDQGKFSDAEEIFRCTLQGREAQLGMNHPETINSVNNLGEALKAQGKLSEAEPLYKRALEIRETQMGATHPDTLISVNNLGALYQDQGNLEAAEPLYRRAFLSREAQLGDEHPKTLSSMFNLATLLEAKGQLQEAEELFLRELAAMEEIYGSEHMETRSSKSNLERFQRKQKEAAKM